MDGIGAEVSQKIRSAIKAKLTEIGVYVDEELPDYVMVMVANKRSKEQMDDDLKLFLGKHTSLFTTWLHHVLQKLQEVTVANLGIKRKISSDDTKKKKKTKLDGEKNEPKKKIKTEPVEGFEQEMPKSARVSSKERTDGHKFVNDGCDTSSSKSHNETVVEHKRKEKRDGKSTERSVKERKISSSSSKSFKQQEEPSNSAEDSEDKNMTAATKSQSVSSEADDLDDADCINIRTDGELLDTTEEANGEELPKQSKENFSKNNRKVDKKQTDIHKNIITSKEKTLDSKKQRSPSPTPPLKSGKVLDARELLNRKKAAKQVAETESRSRKRSVDRRSESPVRKRKRNSRDNVRSHHEDRDESKRSGLNLDKETYNHKNSSDSDKDRKGERIRNCYSTKRKEDRSRRTDSRDHRNESDVRRTARNNSDDWTSSRLSRAARVSENRKADREVDSSGSRRDSEEPRKRGGVLSQVVLRSPEPEDKVETPVPSVVKITPRPRRPPSQQPSSTLIMKAISEANRSLANVPPRPDSTQLTRKKPVLTRTLRQLEKIHPENIAISITNSLALQNVGNNLKAQEISKEDGHPRSPKDDKSSDKESPKHHAIEDNSSEPDNVVENDIPPVDEEWKNKEPENIEEYPQQQEEIQQPVMELEAPSNLEPSDEPMEEMSDPQFVVTLNGYDPDGIYSQSELDLGEDVDEEEWLKDADDDPILTSTPDIKASPRPMKERLGSPIIHINKPSVNHSNLITVEIMKTKATDRCKYWPACRLADKCTFYHPTQPCKAFPACKFGDSCLYIHPQCKYNLLCTRKDCIFSHTPVHTPLQPQAVAKVKPLYASSAAQIPCMFGSYCTNANCQYAHPLRACRYGLYCTKKDCSFDHGKVAPVDKLKWTRGSTTT